MVFEIHTEGEFVERALETFRYQYDHCTVYHEYVDLIEVRPESVNCLEAIPFLPIQFFKTHRVISGEQEAEIVFESSGTGGEQRSQHHVTNLDLYIQSFTKGFELFYGDPHNFRILALLPSYLEREGSSLVFMMDHLIQKSTYSESSFYLHELEQLADLLSSSSSQPPTILFGVSYALLDLAERVHGPLGDVIVMETGGMKGTRVELPKEQLHHKLCTGFGLSQIHAEYGMTELLSQAYSSGGGKFFTPSWMRVFIRDVYDPFSLMPIGKSGGINIIDLANRNSCSFIETQDLGKTHTDGSFELLGRLNNSDIRGCNLLVD